MPKKSKKSKSNRQTLKHKYKVLKKVKKHHRKKRKEAKKLGIKKKAPKDPGIPNSWPFKEELIQQMQAQRERAAARQQALREGRLAAAAQAADGAGQESLQQLQAAAIARGRDYDTTAARSSGGVAVAGGAYVDSSRKAFYKEFVRVVEASDVVIEVLDARDPAGSRCLEVERFARRLGPNKKIILLLNKIDLVPREVAEAWLRYFREELPAVAFKCSTQRQATNLGRKSAAQAADAAQRGTSECLGADTLLQLLKNYARGSSGLKTAITVGVVGLPNVGKSSLINSLKRTRVAQVGNTPGVTKAVQEVHLDKQLTLLDSPGVVFADAGADGAAAAALRNCVKVEQLDDPTLPVAEIVRRCPAKQLMALYKVAAYNDTDEFLQHVAAARGKLRRGGTVDTGAAARIVLQDWNDGRIPYYTLPPNRQSEVAGSTALVTDWGANFDAEAVFAAESNAVIAALPSLEGAGGDAFFQMQSVSAAHVDLGAMAREMADEEDLEDEEQGGSDAEDDSGDEARADDSDGDAMDDTEAPAAASKARSGRDKQNVQLYAQQGQFNPHAARADRKRRKKGGDAEAQGSDPNADYDFAEDWDCAPSGNPFDQLVSGSDGDME